MVAFNAVFFLSIASLAAAQTKTILFQPNTDGLNEGFRNQVRPRSFTITRRWGADENVPRQCLVASAEPRNENNNPARRCNPSEINVWTVQYDDCSETWNFCRCTNADITEQQMMTEFGRLPVNLRSQVRTLMGLPWDRPNDGQGQAWGLDLRLLGRGTSGVTFATSPTVLFHEGGHIVDYAQGSNFGADPSSLARLSNAAVFRDAIRDDTCFIDGYSRDHSTDNPPVEVWAQAFMVHRYLIQVGALPNNLSPTCASRQINAVTGQTDSVLSGNTCNLQLKSRVPADALVPRNTPVKKLRKFRRRPEDVLVDVDADAAANPQLCAGFSDGPRA